MASNQDVPHNDGSNNPASDAARAGGQVGDVRGGEEQLSQDSGASADDSAELEVTFQLPYEEVPGRGSCVFYQTPDDHLYR